MSRKKQISKLDSDLARREKGKSQAKIGDIRQIRAKLEDKCAEEMVIKSLKENKDYCDILDSRTFELLEAKIYEKADKWLKKIKEEIMRQKL